MTGRPRGDLSDRRSAHTFTRRPRVSAEAGRQTPAPGGRNEAPKVRTPKVRRAFNKATAV